MSQKANQHRKIANFLETHGSITPMDAFMELHITKLSTRIGEMIRDGYPVIKTMEQYINADGGISRYMRYRKVSKV